MPPHRPSIVRSRASSSASSPCGPPAGARATSTAKRSTEAPRTTSAIAARSPSAWSTKCTGPVMPKRPRKACTIRAAGRGPRRLTVGVDREPGPAEHGGDERPDHQDRDHPGQGSGVRLGGEVAARAEQQEHEGEGERRLLHVEALDQVQDRGQCGEHGREQPGPELAAPESARQHDQQQAHRCRAGGSRCRERLRHELVDHRHPVAQAREHRAQQRDGADEPDDARHPEGRPHVRPEPSCHQRKSSTWRHARRASGIGRSG